MLPSENNYYTLLTSAWTLLKLCLVIRNVENALSHPIRDIMY